MSNGQIYDDLLIVLCASKSLCHPVKEYLTFFPLFFKGRASYLPCLFMYFFFSGGANQHATLRARRSIVPASSSWQVSFLCTRSNTQRFAYYGFFCPRTIVLLSPYDVWIIAIIFIAWCNWWTRRDFSNRHFEIIHVCRPTDNNKILPRCTFSLKKSMLV